jgi:hypothetical protein
MEGNTMTTRSFDEMSDDEFTAELIPSEDDMVRAGGFLAAQTRLEPISLLRIFTDANTEGRTFHVMTALAETAVRAMNLRDDPDALGRLLEEINAHALHAAMGTTTEDEGDTHDNDE